MCLLRSAGDGQPWSLPHADSPTCLILAQRSIFLHRTLSSAVVKYHAIGNSTGPVPTRTLASSALLKEATQRHPAALFNWVEISATKVIATLAIENRPRSILLSWSDDAIKTLRLLPFETCWRLEITDIFADLRSFNSRRGGLSRYGFSKTPTWVWGQVYKR